MILTLATKPQEKESQNDYATDASNYSEDKLHETLTKIALDSSNSQIKDHVPAEGVRAKDIRTDINSILANYYCSWNNSIYRCSCMGSY